MENKAPVNVKLSKPTIEIYLQLDSLFQKYAGG